MCLTQSKTTNTLFNLKPKHKYVINLRVKANKTFN